MQQYVETLCNLTSLDAPMDQLDGKLIDLFAQQPRLGVLEASRRLGVARGTVQARLDKLTSHAASSPAGARSCPRTPSATP